MHVGIRGLSLILCVLLLPATARAFRRRLLQKLSVKQVVKAGGSAITDKQSFETLKDSALQHTAASLARSELATSTVLVHGAGSFGHFQASEHAVSKGEAHERFSWHGFAQTRSSVTRLNALVVSALLREGLAACTLHPFPGWRTRSKRTIVANAMSDVRLLLSRGLLPVMHGDAVFDSSQGAAVLSGDALVVALCKALRPERVVFLTDVAGVYDRPPGQPVRRVD